MKTNPSNPMNPTHPTAPASMAIEMARAKKLAELIIDAKGWPHDLADAQRENIRLRDALSAMYCAGFWTADEFPNLPDHQRKAITQARAALQSAKE